MNNTMKLLYDEHEITVNAIDAAQQARSLIGKDDIQYEKTIRSLINFFRSYADKFHHYKEEIILFPEMEKKNELLSSGVIKEMFENHENFREMIKEIEKNLNEKKYPAAQKELEQYAEALLDHIAVENDEVFQMAETLLSETELQNMHFRFEDCDRELGIEMKKELAEMAATLRKQLLLGE